MTLEEYKQILLDNLASYPMGAFSIQSRIEDLLYVEWSNVSSYEDIYIATLAHAEEMRRYGVRLLILNFRESVGDVPEKVFTWLQTRLLPLFESYGLKAMITIRPKDSCMDTYVEKWMEIGAGYTFEIELVQSLDEALQYANDHGFLNINNQQVR